HERILDVNTISNFTNINNLPLFLTATCELARFDNPEYFSAGERLAMNSTGGAIALLTTTRVVFAGSNMQMDMAFFDVALFNDTISDLTLGKINMLTKNGVPVSNSSKPNFSLLGDPALRLRYPKYEVVTTHINGSSINTSLPDTIKALQEVEMWGHISDAAGNKLDDYNGFIYPVVYDKISTVKTLNNDFDGNLGESQSYNVYNKVIFKGKSTVSRGDFKFKFVVPLDINYSVGSGRVSYYGLSGSEDAHGYFQNVFIGSSLSGSQLNKVGPDIKIYFNDTTFVSGGVSNTSPILIARLEDDNGINTIANSIGHDIVAILDDDTQNPVILNNYYLSDLDTYKSGEIRYQLENLESGNHTLKIRAWDVHNNSNTESIDFVVEEDANIAI
ncbi:MAG: C25 family cysteine peptidase, partial [Flavobacteriales bacterium]